MPGWNDRWSRRAALLGSLIAGVFSSTNSPAGHTEDSQKPEMIALVVLANTFVDLTFDSIRAKLNEIFPGEFLPPREIGSFVIEGPTPGGFFIKSNLAGATGLFLLHNVPEPYWKFSDFAKVIADPTIRKKAMAQRCWLSVDRIGRHGGEEDGYRFIEQVLAKLAPADAAFLVHPSKLITIPFDDELRARLARAERILPGP
jgi:hypothetical protein